MTFKNWLTIRHTGSLCLMSSCLANIQSYNRSPQSNLQPAHSSHNHMGEFWAVSNQPFAASYSHNAMVFCSFCQFPPFTSCFRQKEKEKKNPLKKMGLVKQPLQKSGVVAW